MSSLLVGERAGEDEYDQAGEPGFNLDQWQDVTNWFGDDQSLGLGSFDNPDAESSSY